MAAPFRKAFGPFSGKELTAGFSDVGKILMFSAWPGFLLSEAGSAGQADVSVGESPDVGFSFFFGLQKKENLPERSLWHAAKPNSRREAELSSRSRQPR